jgi:hypothetical protein
VRAQGKQAAVSKCLRKASAALAIGDAQEAKRVLQVWKGGSVLQCRSSECLSLAKRAQQVGACVTV